VLESFAYILKRRTFTAPNMLAQREKKEEKEKEKTKGNKNTRPSLKEERDEKNGWVNEKHGKSRDARRMSKCTVY